MSVRSILLSEPSESQWKLLWGSGYLVSATALLTLTTVHPDHVVLQTIGLALGIGFLGVVPGYLVRKVLRIDESSVLLAVLNSVGLSVLYCVGLAVLVDTVLVGAVRLIPGVHTAGITGSLQGVTYVTALLATVGFGLAYVLSHRDWEPGAVSRLLGSVNQHRGAVVLLTAIPALSVLGTRYVNEFNDGRIALAFVAVAALVPLLLRAKVIPRDVEAYAIFCVALGVLYHTTLISPHIWGWDIHYEYGTALHFLEQGYWNPTYASSLTPLLTITLYSGLFSEVTTVPLDTVFKAAYPVLFALMPVGVYWLSYRLTEDRLVAALAPFFVIFYYGFFKVIPGKQSIAEVFLVFVLIALAARGITTFQRRVLVIGFFIALVFSHYATSLLLVLFLGAAYVGLRALVRVGSLENADEVTFLRPGYVLLFGAIWLVWFGLTANGVNLDRVAEAGLVAIQGLFGQLSNRSGVAYATRSYGSILWTLYKGLHMIVIGLGGLGILGEGTRLLRRRTVDARGEYAVLASVAYAFVGASTIVTFNMGFDRAFHIGLVILAPLVVLGAKWSVRSVSSRVPGFPAPEAGYATAAVAVFLVVMFVFSSGAVFVAAGDDVPEYSIGLDKRAGFPVYTQEEVTTTRWASEHLPACAKIGVYSDRHRPNSRDGLLLGEVVPPERIETIEPDRTTPGEAAYVYVSDRPLDRSDDLGSYIDPKATAFHSEVLSDATVVYSRGPARIYRLGSQPECTDEEDRPESLGERSGPRLGEQTRSEYSSPTAGYPPVSTATRPPSPIIHNR